MKSYRADIDGLRALAVIPVVLFHIGFPVFPGGYIGVDIFFVISGYLITSTLNDDFRHNRYSIAAFYERRIKRIFPAFFVVVASAACTGVLLLLPQELEDLGQSIWGACLFVSNITFWQQSGDYFGLTSERQPLLHTWSLSVEEQFYIVFPILLGLLHRSPRRAVTVSTLIALFVLSFALSIYATTAASVANFYLLPTRAWELLAGSLLALAILPKPSSRLQAEIEAAFGLVALIVPLLLYGPDIPFPGLTALPPVAGAFLIIHAGTGDKETAIARLLSHPVPRFFGLISYSLYLWHWPIIVYSRYYFLEIGLSGMIAVLAVSILVATLSWRYVERPFRRPTSFRSRPRLFLVTASLLAVASLCGLVFKRDGLPGRFPPAIIAMASKKSYWGPGRGCGLAYDKRRTLETLCVLGAAGVRPDLLVVGDSHADAAAAAVFDAARVTGHAGYQITATGYRPLVGYRKIGEPDKYAFLTRLTLDLLDRHPEVTDIIVPIYWHQAVSVDSYEDAKGARVLGGPAVEAGLRALIGRYPQRRFLLVLSPANSPLFGGDIAARALWFGHQPFAPAVSRATFEASQAAYAPIVQRLRALPNVTIVSFADKLCDRAYCRGTLNGKPAYADNNHLSYAAAKLLDPEFETFLRKRVQSGATSP